MVLNGGGPTGLNALWAHGNCAPTTTRLQAASVGGPKGRQQPVARGPIPLPARQAATASGNTSRPAAQACCLVSKALTFLLSLPFQRFLLEPA